MREPLNIGREEAVRRAAQRWQEQLVDVSGRNRLLNYRDLQVGTLDLTPGPDSQIKPQILDSLLDGKAIYLSSLYAGVEPTALELASMRSNQVHQTGLIADQGFITNARKRLSTIYRKSQEYFDEKGINTLFAAVGLATWSVTDRSYNAPVILVPITVSPVDATRLNFKIEVSGDPHLNPVLNHVLQTQYGLEQYEEDDELLVDLTTSFTGLMKLLRELEGRWNKVPGLAITDRMVLGNFSYTNMPMVEDLKNNLESFARNDFVAAIAGDKEAREVLAANIQDPPPSQPDIDPPESEFLVLDADSSQHRAINRALTGKSLVIWGPPGTGKSQTIANLIATLVANGKSVLFVAEKRAAIDMVVTRLNGKGLSNLVMDIHGGVKSKSEFAQSIDASIRSIMSIPESDHSALHDDLSKRRAELIAYKDAVHQPRLPWNVSAYEVLINLIGSPQSLQSIPQLLSDKARALNRQDMNRLLENIREWIDLDGPAFASQYPEWDRSNINTREDARKAFDLVRDLSSTTLPDTRSQLFASLERVGIAPPDTVGDWLRQLQWLWDVSELLKRFYQDIYSLDHTSLIAGLEPASRWWMRSVAPISPKYRAAKKAVQATRKDGTKLSGFEALRAVSEAQEHLRKQPRDFHELPKVPDDLIAILTIVQELSQSLEELGNLLSLGDILNTPHKELEEMLGRLASQGIAAANLLSIRELERTFAAAGVDRITTSVGKEIHPKYADAAVEQSWLKAVSDDIFLADPQLSKFTQAAHSRSQEGFVELDHRHLKTAAARINRAAAEAAIEAMNAHREETDLLRRQAALKRRHLPVRRLFRQAPNVLTAIRPCWTMSPLQVAEILPVDAGLFDVVIFDEASQIPPAEAIGSIARAPQTVIAGDDRQLPPTNFFQKQEADDPDSDDDEDEDDQYSKTALTDGIESILKVATAIPIRQEMLRWHYRSRDDRLIAFSNTNIYGETLTAFPGTTVASPLSFHLVPFRPLPRKSTRSHPDEVDKVVDMIIEHARESPDESLGVITFGSPHADNIEEALRSRLREMDVQPLEKFFSEESSERFFIKNIERVQGDERDVIFLSVGYHKAANGTLPYRFGPLNQEGGERRLNVAITRARSRIHVVSSFSHYDMEPGKSTAKGVELLRQYLEFAAAGGSELSATRGNVPLNGFELDVKNRLEAKGIPITPQYGVSGYRIDFACAHPNQPGRMVLAIEADGASYHSTPTARDRDRLRQEVLEDKGWRFHRIWSTEWFRNRDKEVERAFETWKEAVRLADNGFSPSTDTTPKDNEPPKPEPAEVPPRPRGPRPNIWPGKKIDDYYPRELVELALWITSDTLLRTDERLMAIMREFLGFKRRGSRIDAALSKAITEMRRRQS